MVSFFLHSDNWAKTHFLQSRSDSISLKKTMLQLVTISIKIQSNDFRSLQRAKPCHLVVAKRHCKLMTEHF